MIDTGSPSIVVISNCYDFYQIYFSCTDIADGCGGTTVSFSRVPDYFTPVAGTSIGGQNCLNCRPLTCPPSLPCKLGKKCYEAECNCRGSCWCPKRKRYNLNPEIASQRTKCPNNNLLYCRFCDDK